MKRLPTENAVSPSRRHIETMKKRAKLTMSTSSLATAAAVALLCCCTCLLGPLPTASGLPITSKPLDNNPDHLTWEAAWLSGDSRGAGPGGKAKKITPKSIFIAPQLNGFNGSLCPPDMKVDYNGKCIQVVNINPADIVLTKLQSLLGDGGGASNVGGSEDYDYEYDTSGPFQVNLPLSIDLEEPPKRAEAYYDTTLVDVPSSTTGKDYLKRISTVPAYQQQTTFLAETSRRPTDQTVAESQTDISFLAFESLPNGTLSTKLEVDGNNGTIVQQFVLSSTAAAPTTVTTLDPAGVESSAASSASTLAAGSTDTVSTTVSATTEDLSSSTVTESSVMTTQERLTSESLFATTTQTSSDQELEGLKAELAAEALLLEPNHSSTTELPSTDMSGFETEPDTLSTVSTTVEDRLGSTMSSDPSDGTTPFETTTMKVLIHTMPSIPTTRRLPSHKPVQIVTPVRTKWYSPPGATPPPFIVASYTQQERTTRATPETTTASHQRRTTEAPLLVMNDTEADKKNRDVIHRQEMKDKLRETMDTNNRFVYHHLAASPTPAPTPSTTADHNYVDQLKKINEIIAENKQRHQQAFSNSRIRFPSQHEDHSAAASSSSGNMVRFPGSVSNRITPNSNRLPDIFPKKSHDTTTQRPPFWWLPSGWEVDQTGQKPMLLRFWSRMPLVRDQSLTTSGSGPASSPHNTNFDSGSTRWRPSAVPGTTSPASAVAPRGNSKSPSESFYKEVSSQDVYKVLNMRQLKHRR